MCRLCREWVSGHTRHGADKKDLQDELLLKPDSSDSGGDFVRLNKVLRLRRAIEEGRYVVDSRSLADCILTALHEG